MAADSSGSIWFWSLFDVPVQLKNGIWKACDTTLFASNWGSGISVEPNGTVWFSANTVAVSSPCPPGGTFEGGVASYDGSNWKSFSTHNSGLVSNNVNCVYADASGRKWFGTYDKGISTFNNTTWTTYDTTNSGLRNNDVTQISQDYTGRIWIITSSGMCSYLNGTWRSDTIHAFLMCRDYSGNMWFVTGGSIFMSNGTSLTTYAAPTTSTSTSSIAVAPDHKLWIGVNDDISTQGGGVYSFDGTTWTLYTVENSFVPYDIIGAVFADKNGNKYFALSQPRGGLAIFNENGITSVNSPVEQILPTSLLLYQNYPNPFNPTTTISFQLPSAGHVTLKVFDVLGREVTTLVNEQKPAGSYKVKFDAINLSSGTYFYRLQTNDFTQTKKLILIR